MTLETVPTSRARWPGRAALASGVVTLLLVGAGVVATGYDAFESATVAASAALVTSALAVLGGIVAAIGNWERGAAIGGIALGLFGNPLMLTFGLGAAANV